MPSFKAKEPRVRDRKINGLMYGRVYTPEARFWIDTPPRAADSGQDMMPVFVLWGKGRWPIIEGY